MRYGTQEFTRPPVPPPAEHSFARPDDPAPLRSELKRLRHEEWKRATALDFAGAAAAAEVRTALLRGYEAGEGSDDAD